jgi:hypothetical protein
LRPRRQAANSGSCIGRAPFGGCVTAGEQGVIVTHMRGLNEEKSLGGR